MSRAPDKSDIGESGKCLPLFAFRAPRPARVVAVPRGSHYAHLGAAGAPASGRARSVAARPRKPSQRTYRIVWLRGSVSTYIQNCLSTWEPKKWCIRPPPPPTTITLLIFVDCNLQTKCTAPHHGLTTNQVSA